MSQRLTSRRFSSLDDLTSSLQKALKSGKAINFHNNNSGIIRQTLSPSFDSIMIFRSIREGTLIPDSFNHCYNKTNTKVSFCPYSENFFSLIPDKGIIEIGKQLVLAFNHSPLTHDPGKLYILLDQLESKEDCPRIGTLHTIYQDHRFPNGDLAKTDGFEFIPQEIYYFDRK